MKKYENTEWQYMAAMARDYASKMQSNNDVDAETGKYLYAIIDEYDRNASSVLKRLYENEGVVAVNICTYQGGYQTICVKYTDETEYNFDTNGRQDSSLDDMICNEIYAYITGRIDESKSNRNMKTENRKRNVVRLTESQLKQMIAESVKNLLNEGSYAEGLSSSQDFNEIKTKILWQVKRAKECLNSIEGIMNPDNEWESYHLALAISGLKEDVEYMQELGKKAGEIMHRISFNSK